MFNTNYIYTEGKEQKYGFPVNSCCTSITYQPHTCFALSFCMLLHTTTNTNNNFNLFSQWNGNCCLQKTESQIKLFKHYHPFFSFLSFLFFFNFQRHHFTFIVNSTQQEHHHSFIYQTCYSILFDSIPFHSIHLFS